MRIKAFKMRFVLIIILLLVGCSDNEYKQFTANYERVYFEITEVVDSSDISLTLEQLQKDNISTKIDELNELLDKISDKVPENQEQHYEKMKDWYEGLILLRDFYGNEEKLTFNDNRMIFKEVVAINLRRKQYLKD